MAHVIFYDSKNFNGVFETTLNMNLSSTLRKQKGNTHINHDFFFIIQISKDYSLFRGKKLISTTISISLEDEHPTS